MNLQLYFCFFWCTYQKFGMDQSKGGTLKNYYLNSNNKIIYISNTNIFLILCKLHSYFESVNVELKIDRWWMIGYLSWLVCIEHSSFVVKQKLIKYCFLVKSVISKKIIFIEWA